MTELQEIKTKIEALESRMQKFISLHERLKSDHQELLGDNRKLQFELEDERGRTKRMEEGYKNLKEVEKVSKKQSISQIKRKINDIIGEIDKNMTLLDVHQK